MRLYVHDYAGHAFAVELSRELARRGHTVRHGYSSTNMTPQGALARRATDAPTFQPDPIETGAVEKRSRSLFGLVARRRAEQTYGLAAAERVRAFRPDVVLAGNTPLDALAPIQAATRAVGAGMVNWLQDVLSVGTRSVLKRKIPVLGDAVGRLYETREGALLRGADGVVVITDDFRPLLAHWGVDADRVATVENWAPLAGLPVRDQDNDWSRAHGLAGERVVLYSGTLGMKHDPRLLARLSERLAETDPAARVVVVSEGAGADWLAEHAPHVTRFPFQPFQALPDVFASATLLTAILEPDAGAVSVPSKVLAYLCAQRPILLSVPEDNLAARIVDRETAGVVVSPGDADGFVQAGLELMRDAPAAQHRRSALAAAGRAYAERTFDIGRVADRFETILADARGAV